jgi:two-component system response regulator YesN
MLKALLFDDEYIVLEALSALVDWEGLGIELAGTAGDGIAALALFRAERPDIVLTDIRMPGMDGLTLIEQILQEGPDTICIVFSGFNEFEYVKRAIQLGVADYVEKPITEEIIEKALRKALEQIGSRNETKALKLAWENSRQELLEKATWELLQYGRSALPKWLEGAGEEAHGIVGVTVLAASEDFPWPPLPDTSFMSLRNGPEFLNVLFHTAEPTRELWDSLVDAADHAEKPIGIGLTYTDPADAANSCREAQRALKSALFMQIKGAVRFDELGSLIKVPDGLHEREEALLVSLRAGSRSGLLEQVDRFIQWLHAERLDPEIAEREMLKLIYLALDVAQETGESSGKPDALKEGYMPHVEIREAATRGGQSQWFRTQFEQIADWSLKAKGNAKHTAVEQAQRYIEHNVSRDVSLQEVADHVGLNATYLSVLFKEVVGETYIKYVTRYRMELAKVLLRKGLKVQEASEKVGYLTHRHFAEVFKKYTGLTPGQYKDGESEKTGPRTKE